MDSTYILLTMAWYASFWKWLTMGWLDEYGVHTTYLNYKQHLTMNRTSSRWGLLVGPTYSRWPTLQAPGSGRTIPGPGLFSIELWNTLPVTNSYAHSNIWVLHRNKQARRTPTGSPTNTSITSLLMVSNNSQLPLYCSHLYFKWIEL